MIRSIASFVRLSLPVLVGACALAGCTAAPGAPTVAEEQAPIIGGTTDTGDPSVVLLFAQVPGAQGGSLCTAEVISPHVVLTAAHCVSPEEVGAGAQFVVYPGADFSQATQANVLPVSETHFDQQFNTNNLEGGHDVGVAILKNPAPVAPLAVNRTPLDASFVGKPVRFVGYGLDNAQAQTGAGVKRQTTTTLTDYNSLLIHFSDGQHETCNGDSGGPAFMTVNGKEVIVGLTSFGDVNCNQGGYDTRVDALLSFIDQYVNQADPPPPDMGSPPDMAAPPDLAQPPSPPSGDPPSSSSTPTGDDPGSAGSQPGPGSQPPAGSTTQPTAPSGRGLGEACASDNDCSSHVCGLGTQGTLVCVSGNAAAGGMGCAFGGSGADGTIFGFLVMMALLLGRGLGRRRRD
jgi:V8-like Glu-specific endopeptidase